MKPFPFPATTDYGGPWASARIVNFVPEVTEAEKGAQAKSKIRLIGTPGLVLWATLPAPVRGFHDLNGVACAVAGNAMYRFDAAGTATAMTGTVAGTGPVTMADNGTQILIGTNAADAVLSGTTVTTIADSDFGGASSVAFLSGWGITPRPDTGTWAISALNDFTSWHALDIATAEYRPDPIIRTIVDAGEILHFGTKTLELWGFVSGADFPFQRYPGANGIIERGCAAPWSVAKLDQSVFWLADDLTIRRIEGTTPRKVSSYSLDDKIAGFTTVSDAIGSAHVWKGRPFYVLTFPTEGRTFVLDASTGLIHERRSGTADTGRWRAEHYLYCYGKHLVSDANSGKIFYLSDTAYAEDGETYVAEAVSPHFYGQADLMILDAVHFDMKTGVGLATGQGSAPRMMVDMSRDGGVTYGNEKLVDIGAIGERQKFPVARQFGLARNFTLRARISDPVPREIYQAYYEGR